MSKFVLRKFVVDKACGDKFKIFVILGAETLDIMKEKRCYISCFYY